ncbi:MAG: TonB-dependent receptor [Bacteriovoracaceae bacterium]|nr:TonB-dependent receptor [Bacteriovoracaceae bacterium]
MKSLILGFFLFSPLVFSSDQPIIVTAEKFVRDYSQSTSSILKISEKTIERSGATNVAELLKQVADINLFTSGSFGKASSLFLRGTSNRHTLVLVDGVRVTDLTAIGGGSRLEFLNTQNIESIEILKGSQGVLYGAEAIGGVIKITTKGKNQVMGQLGSFQQHALSGDFNLSKGKRETQLSLSHDKARGISSFNEKKVLMAEKDGYENFNLKLNLGQKYKGHVYKLNSAFQKSESDFDSTTADVSGNMTNYQTNLVSFSWLKSYSELINPNFLFEKRSVKTDSTIIFNNSSTLYQYSGDTTRAELINKSYLTDKIDFISGAHFEREKTESLDTKFLKDRSRERMSAYGHFRYDTDLSFGEIFVETGGRFESIQNVDDESLYRVALGLKRGDLTLKFNQSTGFKAPSLYQNFSSFGSMNLKVEKSKSKEISIFYKKAQYQLEASYFDIFYSNFIDFDSLQNRYANLGAQNNKGVELMLSGEIKKSTVALSANFLRATNPNTGEYALRRPRQKFTLNIDTPFKKSFNLGLNGSYVGSRQDVGNIRMPSFLTFDTFLAYSDSMNKVSLFVKNILNREYEEIRNFGTPDRNFLLAYGRSF